jgi:hypothetical protein
MKDELHDLYGPRKVAAVLYDRASDRRYRAKLSEAALAKKRDYQRRKMRELRAARANPEHPIHFGELSYEQYVHRVLCGPPAPSNAWEEVMLVAAAAAAQ